MNIRSVFQGSTIVYVVICILAGVLQFSARRIVQGDTNFVVPPPQYIGLSIDTRVVRNFVGVKLLFADLLWIDTLFKSDITREKVDYTTFYRAAKTIVELDPDNLLAYYVFGLYLSVIKDDIKGATSILRLGTQYVDSHPTSWDAAWKIPFSLGYNLIFEEHLFEEGGRWVLYASQMKGAPKYVTDLGAKVATESGRLDVASHVLGDLYRRATRADEREAIEKKMVKVAVAQELLELNDRFQKYKGTRDAHLLSPTRQFQQFLRLMVHSGKDMLGRKLGLKNGSIVSLE